MPSHTRSGPVIGLTLDHEAGGGYSKYPWYAIRENYCTSISRLGAAPIGLPHEVAKVDDYLNLIDGLIIIGGAFDVPPEMYGEQSRHATVTLKETRTAFEWAITKGAVERKIPILGICGGEQLLNVVLGGTLIQHIPDTIPNALEHEQPNPRTEPGHSISIVEGTLLHRIVGTKTMEVNSAHHQAVAKPAPGVVVNATAPDGVVEGIEYRDHPFCLGVEWHPEYRVTPDDDKVLTAFVDACRNR